MTIKPKIQMEEARYVIGRVLVCWEIRNRTVEVGRAKRLRLNQARNDTRRSST